MFTPKIGEDFFPFWGLHIFQRGWWETTNYNLICGTYNVLIGIISSICIHLLLYKYHGHPSRAYWNKYLGLCQQLVLYLRLLHSKCVSAT